jgi:hypothetical protein
MLSPLDYLIWCAGPLVEAFILVRALVRRDFLRYFSLNLYLAAAISITFGQMLVFHAYGRESLSYVYSYYWGDSLLVIFLFFVVIGLYEHVFREMKVHSYIRFGAVMLLVGTTIVSYLIVHHQNGKLATRLIVGLSQNLYFVGVVLTYMLWIAVRKMRQFSTRLIQLVLALGIYFSASAASYALRNLFPSLSFTKEIMPLVNLWLPVAWAYTFTFVPERARLATSLIAERAS